MDLVHPRSKRLFLVEDNEDTRLAISLILELKGYLVNSFDRGLPALAAFPSLQPDISIIDLGLPDIDGYEIARTIRQNNASQSTLVALTGYDSDETRFQTLRAGFDFYFVKPANINVICESAEALLAKRRRLMPIQPSDTPVFTSRRAA